MIPDVIPFLNPFSPSVRVFSNNADISRPPPKLDALPLLRAERVFDLPLGSYCDKRRVTQVSDQTSIVWIHSAMHR